MSPSTNTTNNKQNNDNKGILETVDDQLHSVLLPLEGKDYEQWKVKKEAGEDDNGDKAAQETAAHAKAEVQQVKDNTLETLGKAGEKVDKGLHAATLPLEGKDYEEWKKKTYGEEDKAEKKGLIGRTKDTIGGLFTKKEEPEEKEEPPKGKDLTTQAVEMKEEAVETLAKVGDKVDDELHAVFLPLEGKDYEQWKEAKEEERKAEQARPEGGDNHDDFIDKAKSKIGSLFGGKKETTPQASQ